MPVYLYERVDGTCDECPGRFEKLQKLDEEPYWLCPRCYHPVKRVPASFAIGKDSGSPGNDRQVTAEQAAAGGFSQYRRLEKGVYEKTAGNGPPVIVQPPGSNED
jgi:putative FmdB family regulatory protein